MRRFTEFSSRCQPLVEGQQRKLVYATGDLRGAVVIVRRIENLTGRDGVEKPYCIVEYQDQVGIALFPLNLLKSCSLPLGRDLRS